MEAYKSLRKDASAGVDGVTYVEYRMEAGRRIQELYERVKAKRYRAQPLRRIYIPKESGNWVGAGGRHLWVFRRHRKKGTRGDR